MKGVVLTEENRYSVTEQCFTKILCHELDLQIENYGKFGSTVTHGSNLLDRHQEAVASSAYTFIEYGGNDCDHDWLGIANSPHGEHAPKTSLGAFGEQFLRIIARIRQLGSTPVMLSLPPILSDAYFSFFSRDMSNEQQKNVVKWLGGDVGIIARWHECYNRALFKIAARAGVEIIDITTPFDTYRAGLNSLYCLDGIHPNTRGHRLIAESIIRGYNSLTA